MSLNNMSIDFNKTDNTCKMCITKMFPSMSDLSVAMSTVFSPRISSLPNFNIDLTKYKIGIPKIPNPIIPSPINLSIPSPIFHNMRFPSMEAVYTSFTMMSVSVSAMIQNMVKTITDTLGLGITEITDKIDTACKSIYKVAVTFKDIIKADIKTIEEKILAAMKTGVKLTWIPSPLFEGISNKAIEIYHIVQQMISNYWLAAMNVITSYITKIENFINNLEIAVPSIPTIPPIPTVESILAAILVYANVPDFKTIIKKYKNKLSALMDMVSAFILAGFPFTIKSPEITIPPNISSPAIHLTLTVTMFIQDITTQIVKFFHDCVTTLLSALNITIPSPFPICMSVPIPVTPKV